MSSFRTEPILLIHVLGLATLPIFLGICMFFLGVGEPLLPKTLEIFIIGAIGTLPLLWMQLRRPFYIFAILGLAVKPEQLTDKQRKILCLINTTFSRRLALLSAIILLGILYWLYDFSQVVANFASFMPQWRSLALLGSGVAFLASNLFLQIPVSVARVFVTKETEFVGLDPLPLERIKEDFTILGVQVNQILPQLTLPAKIED